MVVFTINKSLEGYIKEGIYIRVFQAGWVGWHYVIEEQHSIQFTKFYYVNSEQLVKYLDNFKDKVTNETITSYLSVDINEEKIA